MKFYFEVFWMNICICHNQNETRREKAREGEWKREAYSSDSQRINKNLKPFHIKIRFEKVMEKSFILNYHYFE